MLVEVLADVGDTDRALALGEDMLARGETWVRLTLAEVAAEAGRWDVAASGLTALPDTDDPRARVLAARLAHERGKPEDAQSIAELALIKAEERNQWSVACQALEVMGRAARVTDLEAARDAFLAAERLAVDHDLPLERVSALHELGTVDLLLDGSTSPAGAGPGARPGRRRAGPRGHGRRADRGQPAAPRRGRRTGARRAQR